MADMMTFPDTVEEFMEEYKLVDTEQVYTNGTELVPIFRMEQWFEHEKAQHSQECEGTTSDLISRQEARHALCKAVHKGEDIPCENQTASCLWTGTRVCDFVREIDALPSVQPQSTAGQLDDDARSTAQSTDLIDRQAVIDELRKFKPEIIPYEKARTYVEETVKTIYDRVVELPTIHPEPSIPVTWIEGQIERLNNTGNRYAKLTANIIKAMLNEYEWQKGELNERY